MVASGVFNLGSGVGFSILDTVAEKLNEKELNYEFGDRREGDPTLR